MTPTQEIETKLEQGLGLLRRGRPEFQNVLEARLAARLAGPTRPAWRGALSPASSGASRGSLVTRRRVLMGLGAAAAGVLALSSVGLPLGQPGEASASEILERAEAFAGNPVMANLKSFHLVATTKGKLGPSSDASRTTTTEQWFVSPNRMRTESRSKASDGKDVVSGFVHDGDSFKHYLTPGTSDTDMIFVIGAPALKVGEQKPGDEVPRANKAGVFVRKAERSSNEGAVGVVEGDEKEFSISVRECRESRRSGEETIAGRKTYVVETDFTSCLPEGAPEKLPGKHVAWIDKETYLPLKMEAYAKDGKPQHSYEVTKVEYDVSIADSVFKDIPPKGTELKEMPFPPGKPGALVGPAGASKPEAGTKMIWITESKESR